MNKPVTCVKIEHKNKTLFEQVAVGEPFLFGGSLYVRCDLQTKTGEYFVNAVGIGNNKQRFFCHRFLRFGSSHATNTSPPNSPHDLFL